MAQTLLVSCFLSLFSRFKKEVFELQENEIIYLNVRDFPTVSQLLSSVWNYLSRRFVGVDHCAGLKRLNTPSGVLSHKHCVFLASAFGHARSVCPIERQGVIYSTVVA